MTDILLARRGPHAKERMVSEQHGWRWLTGGAAALVLAWATPGLVDGAPEAKDPAHEPPASGRRAPADEDDDGPPIRPPQDPPDVWPAAEPGEGGGARPDAGQRPSRGQLVREGSFLDARRGRMAALRSGGWLYVFDADASGQAEPPMVLLPCLRLMEMERLVSAKQETVTFQISGQVTAFQGRNYLLVTYFTTLASEELRPAPQQAPAGAPANRDPSVHELIERARPDDRRPARQSAAPPPASGAADATGAASAEGGRMLREGLTVAARRGRVQRGVGGAWVFMPDNGADKPDGADPAMILQPCLNLERIEKLVGDRGDRVVLSISGQVFAYQGRNYLLPTVYRVEADREGNLGPGQ